MFAGTEPRALDERATIAATTATLLTREVWAPGAQLLPADHPELRITLMASQLIGLVMARYVIRAEPLASLPPTKQRARSRRSCSCAWPGSCDCRVERRRRW